MKKIRLLDTTLREGEQTPGVSFTVRQKLIIARSLDFLGIDAIEVGHPGVSRDIDEFITEVKEEQLKAELIVHARACEQDVEAALETGISRIAVFLGTSYLHLHQQLGTSLDQASRLIYRSVEEITDNGRKVRFSAEDATRANMNVLFELCRVAIEAGADSISLPDTVGIALPGALRSIFLCAKSSFPEQSLDAHCHNDLGLAVANALAAMEGGADCLHVTVNGLGERTGITPLCNLAVALKVQYGIDTVDLRSINEISRMVSKFSGVPLPENQPVVGKNVFSHKAGVHTSAVLKNPKTHEPYEPGLPRWKDRTSA